VNGRAHDMLATGQKSGVLWGVDRDSGKAQVGPNGQSGGTKEARLPTTCVFDIAIYQQLLPGLADATLELSPTAHVKCARSSYGQEPLADC
jgi:hypothetical protein